MSETSALAGLESLRAQVVDAEEHLRLTILECSKAKRQPHRVRSALRDYHTAVAAGDREADPKLERKLHADVRRVEDTFSTRPVLSQGRVIDIEMVDEAAEGRRIAAEGKLTDRQNAVPTYIVKHRDELVAEMIPRSEEARDRLLSALAAFQSAIGNWASVRNSWLPMLERWGISPSELPAHPLAGAMADIDRAMAPVESGQRRDPRRFVPIPASLHPEPSDDDQPEPSDDGGITARRATPVDTAA